MSSSAVVPDVLELLRQLKDRLHIPAETASVGEIARSLAGLRVNRRVAEARAIGLLLHHSEVTQDEALRVLLAKTLVALLPNSLDVIRSILREDQAQGLAEAQFSLFCFLDHAIDGRDSPTRVAVLDLVEGYLLNVRSDEAQAAWMAGDLLGEHWPLNESLRVLNTAALNARFRAGREGALHGLSHALARSSKRDQWSIVDVLKRVSTSDRSLHMRRYAESILGDLRGF